MSPATSAVISGNSQIDPKTSSTSGMARPESRFIARSRRSLRPNLARVEPDFFEVVRNAFEGFVAGVGGRRNIYVHSRGLKVWFDDDTREHYESQLIRVDGEVQLEIGFHAEHPKAPQNDEVLRRLLAVEPMWR